MWEKIHDKVRLWFGLTQTILKIVGGVEFLKEVESDTIAAIGGGITYINSDYFQVCEAAGVTVEALFENADVHEQGHVYHEYEAPGTFNNKVSDVKAVKKFGVVGKAAYKLLNIVYDTIIDVRNFDRGIYDPACILRVFQAKDPQSFKDSLIGEYLVAFREEAVGQPIAWFPIRSSVRTAAKEIILLVRQPLFVTHNGVMFNSQRARVAEISNRLVALFKDELNSFDLPILGNASSSEEAERRVNMSDIDPRDPEAAKIVKDILGLDENEYAFQIIWADAEKSVRFDAPPVGMDDGMPIQSSHLPWRVGEPISNLDVAATMLRTGMFLPGATTIQPQFMPGPGIPKPGPFYKRLLFSADCSGSMKAPSPYAGRKKLNHDLVCAAIFAMIHEGKKKRIPVGGNLFGDENKYFKPTTDYEALAREVWNWVKGVGGGNSCAGTETLREVVTEGSLLVYITDFWLFGHCSVAKQDLHSFIANGADVVYIAMFDGHNGNATGLEYSVCTELKHLIGIALKATRSKLNK